MKKLYFLDEEEKGRILNLHEDATKRQYLNEDTLSDFEAKLPKETKDKFYKMMIAWQDAGTNEQGIVDTLNTFTVNDYNLYNQYLSLKKPEGVTSFEGIINAEMGHDNLEDVIKVVNALKRLGVTATYGTIDKDKYGKLAKPYFKENTFKITSQPIASTSTPNNGLTDAAIACVKQFGNPKPAKTPGFVYVTTDKATVFFGKNYEVRYRPTGGEIIQGNWSCKGNVLNVTTKDGDAWSKSIGGWKNSVGTTKDKGKGVKTSQQTLSPRILNVQKQLGIQNATGKIDVATLQSLLTKLNSGTQAQPVSSLTPSGIIPISNSQPQAGMTADQLNDTIKQLQANANKPV